MKGQIDFMDYNKLNELKKDMAIMKRCLSQEITIRQQTYLVMCLM